MRFAKMLALAAAVMLTAPAMTADIASATEKKVEIRFSAYYPPHYTMFKYGWEPWQKLVEKDDMGITFRNYLNGVLHAAKHGFRAASTDVCDITTGYPSYNRKSFHLGLVNDLPFLFPNTYVGALVMENLYPKYFKQEYEQQGVYLGAWINVGGYNLISKKPVARLEDLKGMKIRSVGGLCSDFLEALGAVPVMIQNAESYSALQSGVVDGVLLASGPIEAMKLHENAKYLTKLNIMNMGIPFCLNKKTFDGLSPRQKTYFYNKLRLASQMAAQSYIIDGESAEARMAQAGVQVSALSPSEQARIVKAVAEVEANYVKKMEKAGYPAKKMMKDLKALREKYRNLTQEEAIKLVTEHPVKGIITF